MELNEFTSEAVLAWAETAFDGDRLSRGLPGAVGFLRAARMQEDPPWRFVDGRRLAARLGSIEVAGFRSVDEALNDLWVARGNALLEKVVEVVVADAEPTPVPIAAVDVRGALSVMGSGYCASLAALGYEVDFLAQRNAGSPPHFSSRAVEPGELLFFRGPRAELCVVMRADARFARDAREPSIDVVVTLDVFRRGDQRPTVTRIHLV